MTVIDLSDRPGSGSDPTEQELADAGAIRIFRAGLNESPGLKSGLRATLRLALGAAVGRLAIPLMIQQTLERGFDDDGSVRVGAIATVCLVTVAVIGATWLAQATAARRLVEMSEDALKDLRSRLFAHIHRLSLADHVERATGAMVTRVTTDIDALARFTEWGMIAWIVNVSLISMTLVVMAVFSWQLTLLVIVVFAPLPFVVRALQRRQLQAFDNVRSSVSNQASVFSEELGGSALVRAHGLQDRSRHRLRHGIRSVEAARHTSHLFTALTFPTSELFGALALGAVVTVGAWQGEAWGLDLDEVVAFVFLVNVLLHPMAEITEIMDQTQTAMAGWRKVLQVLAIPVEIVDPEPGVGLPTGPLAISARSVGFRYRTGPPVLSGVDLELAPGQDVAIVGATGSGKSTFAKLLVRLADPTEGELLVHGVRLADVAANDRHRALRMVPQDGFLFSTTIRENIRYGRPGATAADVDQAIAELGLESWVERLPEGLDTELGERGGRLSVGERQLVALARVQLADPGLLVLDEATSSVDPATEQALARALSHLAAGRTTVTVAHRLSTAERADLVLVFADGRIAEQGTHHELVALGGVYGSLYESWLGAVSGAEAGTSSE